VREQSAKAIAPLLFKRAYEKGQAVDMTDQEFCQMLTSKLAVDGAKGHVFDAPRLTVKSKPRALAAAQQATSTPLWPQNTTSPEQLTPKKAVSPPPRTELQPEPEPELETSLLET
jgi:hypothetical protein